jgi:dTDP-4-amino-4,6-dideoxygalactose transaminase
MDTRYAKIKNIKYPIYKSESTLKFMIQHFFCYKLPSIFKKYAPIYSVRDIIAKLFSLDLNNVFLFNSGSSSIVAILNYLAVYKGMNSAFIPSFSCTELADSVLSANYDLYLYEIDENLNPNQEFLKSMEMKTDIVLITPSIFGKNYYSKALHEYYLNQNYAIIFDEAQSFPIEPRVLGEVKKSWYSVISFGKSKPISSISGGGLIIHNNADAELFDNIYCETETDKRSYRKLYNNFYSNVVVKTVSKSNILKYWINKLGVGSISYSTLEEASINKIPQNIIPYKINILEAECAYLRIIYYLKKDKNQLINCISQINNWFENDIVLPFNKDAKNQSKVILSIPNHYRYYYSNELAKKGIQTTIYYYPLHKLAKYYHSKNEKFLYTEVLASSLLILPINIDTSKNSIKKIINKMEKIK